MINEILDYCSNNHIKCIFLDFFGTIVQRNCSPTEIKNLWAKRLALELEYIIDEEKLLLLRKKSEQAVIYRAKSGEFNYLELTDEIYRRIIAMDNQFELRYNGKDFYRISHNIEVQAELESQSYIQETIGLINAAYLEGIHINIISDFYLGREELKIFLEKEEIYKKIENIFVSSDCKTSKYLGGLYEYACRQVEFSAEQCVMVGDNPKSDIQNAELYGIKGFNVKHSEGIEQKGILEEAFTKIAKSQIDKELGYSNYCFLLYLYIERLYKNLIREGIKDIYFLSREGEFLKKLFDLYINKRECKEINTHYLYVSRKATYPATLKPLDEETFDLLRKYPKFSIKDFLENIGMQYAVSKLGLTDEETEEMVTGFFDSSVFSKLLEIKEFQEMYENSRVQYNSIFKKYCEQEGLISDCLVAIADVGWNGTMQDNIYNALDGFQCVGLYIGLMNAAYSSEKNKKRGLIFSENPLSSWDLNIWKYDNVFLERILWASHGATDNYILEKNGSVTPILKDYASEVSNYALMKPVQDILFRKIDELDNILLASCYTAENFYNRFLLEHIHMLFHVNNEQLNLQRKMLQGQMQNFGHISTAKDSIGATFSKKRLIKKFWSSLHLLKNTEMVFRIFLTYNQKFLIKILYRLHYMQIKKSLIFKNKRIEE